VGGGQEATGQQHLARPTIAEAPEDFLADLGLEPIESQDDTPLRLGQAPQARRVWQREGDQCVIVLQQIGDGPGRHSETTLAQRLMDSWDTVLMGLALCAHEGEDIAAQLVLGQGEASFRFGSVWGSQVGTRRIEAASNLEGEPHDGLQGRHGTIVVIGRPHGLTAAGTLAHKRRQGLGRGWGRAGCGTGHTYHLQRYRLGKDSSMTPLVL
jgi:hypothetical protein